MAVQGSAITAFNHLAAQVHALHKQGLSSSVCQAVVGSMQASATKVYKQCLKEWAGWYAQEVVTNNANVPLY